MVFRRRRAELTQVNVRNRPNATRIVVDAQLDVDAGWRGSLLAYSSDNALTRPERIACTSVAWSFWT